MAAPSGASPAGREFRVRRGQWGRARAACAVDECVVDPVMIKKKTWAKNQERCTLRKKRQEAERFCLYMCEI